MAVLDLMDVKEELDIPLASTASDSKLERICAEAVEWVEDRCGPLEPTTVSARIDGGRPTLVLPLGPVISVTGVVGKSGDSITLESWQLRGQVISSDAALSEAWYDVEYVIGRAAVPPWGKRAALQMARHLWRPSQGPAAMRQGEGNDPMSALRLAEELIKPHRRIKAGF